MPASLAELVYPDGSPSLFCPSSGRLVFSNEDGIDTNAAHSPHLRFIIDWAGGILVADPEVLPASQQAYQRQLVALLSDGVERFDTQNELIAACIKIMPASGLVFEILNPPEGSSDGEVAYFGFDLASIDLDDIQLLFVEELDD
jgi:hypothetical protein